MNIVPQVFRLVWHIHLNASHEEFRILFATFFANLSSFNWTLEFFLADIACTNIFFVFPRFLQVLIIRNNHAQFKWFNHGFLLSVFYSDENKTTNYNKIIVTRSYVRSSVSGFVLIMKESLGEKWGVLENSLNFLKLLTFWK